jgi:hypothetical protein
MECILSVSMILYGFQQSDGINIWIGVGAVFAIIGIWQVQARFPDRDLY